MKRAMEEANTIICEVQESLRGLACMMEHLPIDEIGDIQNNPGAYRRNLELITSHIIHSITHEATELERAFNLIDWSTPSED